MSRTRAFYSVVQYVPDGGRAEAANAGVVVYIPESGKIGVRITPTLERIKKFFSPKRGDRRRIELALEAFRHRLESAQGEFKSEKELEQFILARADAVRMTLPRLVVLNDLSVKLDELYQKLVGDEAAVGARPATAPLIPSPLAKVFDRLLTQKKAWGPRPIMVPETKRVIQIPFTYMNGVENLVLPQSLATRRKPEAKLQKLGFDGFLIHKHRVDDKQSQLVVVSAERANEEVEHHFAEVLPEFNVRFIPFLQVPDFAKEVEAQAHS
jgi:hypothetical protein